MLRLAPLFFSAALYSEQLSLINHDYIQNYLTHEAAWANGHGTNKDDLGCGMLYYALAYMSKAKLCICLGSGGGFVPRVMRQAQRDLGLKDARTILVDANKPGFGTPQWLSPDHFFRRQFSDIEIIMELTKNVAKAHPNWEIDYLHIDADHTLDGAYADFKDYLPLMKRPGIITFHDTGGKLPCAKVISLLKNRGFEIVDFKEYGAGVAIINLH